ncbi:MAG: cytochrome c oxidase subunit II [Candidatus Didemnitutus sp.]|jgi:cytochrome c oxidase subunit 2|nr:cytochrome c oxidase subunit II [Candidatus Didemnitutus sp.]
MTRTRSAHRTFLSVGALSLALLSLLCLTGCSDIFNLSGHMSTRDTAGPVARAQWDVFMVTVWVTLFIFIVVGAVLAYAQIKFRAKNTADEQAEPPPQGHGNPLIEIGLIVASVALLVIIAIPTLKNIWYTHDVPEAEKANAMDINAVGYQWWFKFEYTGEKVQLPDGGEATLVTGNELVIPAGVPVRVHLRTIDVIHSFWVPKLAGKVDMIPNRANFLWMQADKPGYFYGQCAEYCGESHAIMRFRVIALSPSDYVKWLDNQKAAARTATAAAIRREDEQVRMEFASLPATGPRSTLASTNGSLDTDPLSAWKTKQHPEAGENAPLIAEGRRLFKEKTCISCHTVRGHEGIGITGPDLTHVGSRSTIAAGVLENTPERLFQWIKDPNYFKPGNKMYVGGYVDAQSRKPLFTLNDDEIHALVAYLQSLK